LRRIITWVCTHRQIVVVRILQHFTILSNYRAMAIFPFIFIRKKFKGTEKEKLQERYGKDILEIKKDIENLKNKK